MANPTNNEQLLLEYINYTRLDPLGAASMYISSYSPLSSGDADIQSAMTYFGVSGSALKSALSALTATQPLAWSGTLGATADAHSTKMIAADEQSHQLAGEDSLGSRIWSAGYGFSYVGENIYAYADSMLYAHAGFMIDWGFGANGMQDGAGHRVNIMNSTFREAGLGVIQETNTATSVGPWVVTQDFGVRYVSPEVFLLGVSYADNDDNQFYTPGEGRSGMSINASGAIGQSTSSGGYVLEMGAGSKTITFSGGSLASSLSVAASLSAGTNAKIDVVDQSTLLTSVSLTVLSGVTEVHALGIQGLALTGAAGNQKLVGNSGANTLNGAAGADTLIGGAGNDVYYVDNVGDSVRESVTAGVDTGGTDLVQSTLGATTLGSFIENGRILATGTASMTGNSLGNYLYAGRGDNAINGSGGNDTVSYYFGVSGTAGVTVSLANTGAQVTGGSGTDTLAGIEHLRGSNNVDQLTGNTLGNWLYGYGGNDVLSGGNGADSLVGGAGQDSLTGGQGNALFDFNALSEMGVTSTTRDIVTDFVRGQDRIDLASLDANTATSANEAFSATFVAASAAFTAAGQLKFASGVLYGNTDADAEAEFALQLTGVSALSASDVVL